MQSLSALALKMAADMKKALDGTNFCEVDLTPIPPDEAAQRDAAYLNSEQGHENDADGYECEVCNNRGYIYFANGNNVARRDCECWTARRSIRRMMKSGLGSVIAKYTFSKYRAEAEWQKSIKTAAMEFVKDKDARWFFIGGQSGGGKSHICTAICRAMLATKEVHYMLWEDESVELKSIVTDADAYQSAVNRLKNVSVLYVDDFLSGKKKRLEEEYKPSFADIRLAREILNHRYVNGKTTIISSEWYSAEIADIDEALGGRIIEMCGRYCLNIGRDTGKNYRLTIGGQML